jgi:hypothetical protein
MRLAELVAIGAALLTLTACAASMIPGTRVADTAENREIYSLVEKYRSAMEHRDIETLKKLASARYFENASTTHHKKDDYGHSTLIGKVLPKLTDNIKKVEYRIMLKAVSIRGNQATADYEYMWKFLYSEGGREKWEQRNDFNRLDMVREDGAWKIVAGL